MNEPRGEGEQVFTLVLNLLTERESALASSYEHDSAGRRAECQELSAAVFSLRVAWREKMDDSWPWGEG